MKTKLTNSKNLQIETHLNDNKPSKTSNTLSVQEQLRRSRLIFDQLCKNVKNLICSSYSPLIQKNLWAPNDSELKVLTIKFKMNKYPTEEEKLSTISFLKETYHSKITLRKLNKWLQVHSNSLKPFKFSSKKG